MFGSIGVPHGFCFLWNPGLLWLHVLSDSLIAFAYFLIPVVLIRIARKRPDVPFNWIAFCFGAFIVACGITHILDVVTLWVPIYWVSGVAKALTALVSLTTLILLLRLSPVLSSLPSHGAMERANQQIATIFDSTNAGVLSVDAGWKILYMNRNARTTLDPSGQTLGQPLFDAFPGHDPAIIARLHAVMESRETAQFEAFYEPMQLSSTVSAYPSDNGGVMIFFVDISEQKRLQRELDLERDLREQRIESLAHMASGIAHEISNPLGIIHARASDLGEVAAQSDSIPHEVVTAACTSIVGTSNRAMRILRGLKMFAREGTQDPLQPALLGDMITQTVDLVERRFLTHGIALTVDLPATPLRVDCREVQIGQVLLNLLNNAFDAIDSRPGGERWVRITTTEQDDHILIDVTDSGPGVTPENRPLLMKPFFTTKPLGAGIGVGLSLSQAIALEHGGTLVLAEFEQRTCFRLTLPLSRAFLLQETA